MPHIYTKQELLDQYEKLPDALKDAIFSTEVAEKIFETGKKHGLTIEKIGFLAEETGRVILGLTRPNEFVPLIAERLGVAADAAQKIAADINHQIFFPLRDALKMTHQVDVGESAIQRPATEIARARPQDTFKTAVPLSAAPAPVDLRPLARPPTGAPPPAPSAPPISQKVPPIDLRAKPEEKKQQPPLVDIGDIAVPPPRSINFLSREEAEKIVTEKRITPLPSLPQLLGNGVSKLETPFPSGRAEDKNASTANPQVFPQAKKPFSPPIPSHSPQVAPPAPQQKIPPIDLRGVKDISLDFMPPPPTAPRPAPPAPTAPSPSPPPIQTPSPAAKPETPPSHALAPIPLSPPAPSKIPPIDLRPQLKTKPWSGRDPYKEPIE